MARVTENEVNAILDTNLSDLDPFINSANLLVTDVLGGKGLSTSRLKDIELWLAAHFASIRDPDAGMTTQETIGETTAEYDAPLGQALKMTRYGQQALALDTTGLLSGLGNKRASFRAFGVPSS